MLEDIKFPIEVVDSSRKLEGVLGIIKGLHDGLWVVKRGKYIYVTSWRSDTNSHLELKISIKDVVKDGER